MVSPTSSTRGSNWTRNCVRQKDAAHLSLTTSPRCGDAHREVRLLLGADLEPQPERRRCKRPAGIRNWGGNGQATPTPICWHGRIAQRYSEQNFDTIPAFRYMSVEFYGQDSWKVTRQADAGYTGYACQHLGPWTDLTGYGFAIFNPSAYASGRGLRCLPGFRVATD